ncbi:MAG: NUDIX hydrolase [Methylococcales bacterium]
MEKFDSNQLSLATASILGQPPSPAIGVSAIIFDSSERVLLIKRGQPPAFGQWHAPGGKLEPGETMVSACQREVEEETGISGIEIDCLLAVVERRLEGFHYVIIDFLAHLTQSIPTTPVAADDVLDARWVTELELSRLDLAEGLLPILQRARQMHRNDLHNGLYDVSGMGADFLPCLD